MVQNSTYDAICRFTTLLLSTNFRSRPLVVVAASNPPFATYKQNCKIIEGEEKIHTM